MQTRLQNDYEVEVNNVIQAVELHGMCRTMPRSSLIDLDIYELATKDTALERPSLRPAVRHLLACLGLDENRLPQLRLEHKLIQGYILRHYCTQGIPNVYGLSHLLQHYSKSEYERILSQQFPCGYCIKPTVGFAAPRNAVDEHNHRFFKDLNSGNMDITPASYISEEIWCAQERIFVEVEYKVHTLEDSVVRELTLRYNNYDSEANIDKAEAFVMSIMAMLPAGLLKDSFCCWDIALSKSGDFSVLEVNYAGMHLYPKSEYHCSGYFHEGHKAPAAFALLVRHVRLLYGIEVHFTGHYGSGSRGSDYYACWTKWWSQLLEIRDNISEFTEELRCSYKVNSAEALVAMSNHPAQRMFFVNLQRLHREANELLLPSRNW